MSLGIESLNLDFQESKLYIILLANGPQSIGELIKNAGILSADIKKSLEGLKKKGYLHEISGIANRYHALLPYRELKIEGEKTISQMEALASQLDEHISKKLESILTTMKEESERMTNALTKAKTDIYQLETKAESDVEELTAKNVLEVEQENGKSKETLKETIKQKKEDHQALLSNIGSTFDQKTESFDGKFQEINQGLEITYDQGLEELKNTEIERNEQANNETQSIIAKSEENLVQGVHLVRESLQNTGKTVLESINKQNEIFDDQISNTVLELTTSIENTSIGSKENLTTSIESYHTELSKELESIKDETKISLQASRDVITNNSLGNSEKVQEAVNEILNAAQSQITEMLQQTQSSLTQKLGEAKTQVNSSMNQFSETMKTQVDNDFQKVIGNADGVLTSLTDNANKTHQKASSEISKQFEDLEKEGKDKIDTFKGLTTKSLKQSVESLRQEIQSQLKNFESALVPQENELKQELKRFSSEFTASQSQSLNNFTQVLDSFKSEVSTKNQELSEKIKQDISSLKEGIQSSISEIATLVQNYDEKYGEILIESSTKASEGLITKTRSLQEKMVAVLSEMTKSADRQIAATNQLISDSVQTEMSTLENELKDYALKFDEVSKKNDEAMKNYLFSLEKLSSLVTETEHPVVQTAPIISKEATLQYIEGMFARLKGGMTLLIPSIEDIPVDSILATKNHQRINLVSVLDTEKNKDLLKKLLQKPNVRVRKVDLTKAGSIEGYIAADRDGEEVIIGVREDQGETIAIVSQADSFIELMGKIVLGDYFLARSQEIPRIDVGL
jgi:sugar-specific transcriptional regulator TrmB